MRRRVLIAVVIAVLLAAAGTAWYVGNYSHANYGDYGAQENDGQATISAADQQKVVTDEVAALAKAA